jgi:hypothetical protein
MTAAGLIVLSVACLIAAVAGAILVTILDIRAERKWRHWDSMPGATSSDDEQGGDLLTLATKWARDDWDISGADVKPGTTYTAGDEHSVKVVK